MCVPLYIHKTKSILPRLLTPRPRKLAAKGERGGERFTLPYTSTTPILYPYPIVHVPSHPSPIATKLSTLLKRIHTLLNTFLKKKPQFDYPVCMKLDGKKRPRYIDRPFKLQDSEEKEKERGNT